MIIDSVSPIDRIDPHRGIEEIRRREENQKKFIQENLSRERFEQERLEQELAQKIFLNEKIVQQRLSEMRAENQSALVEESSRDETDIMDEEITNQNLNVQTRKNEAIQKYNDASEIAEAEKVTPPPEGPEHRIDLLA